MTVYAVFRGGIYRHECAGVFSTLDLARQAADRLALTEPDDHHSYEAIPFIVDSAATPDTENVGFEEYGGLTEPRSVYTVQRSPRPRCKTCSHPDYCHKAVPGGRACIAISCPCQGWLPDMPEQPSLRRQYV